MNPRKIEALRLWPVPQDTGQVRSFLGLATFFRKFVSNFASMAHALHTLLRKGTPWNWTTACQKSFDQIRNCLVSAPVLAMPDLSVGAPTFYVHCDASLIGIGAVLIQGGQPVAYESRKIIQAECNYTTMEREFLAVV